MEPAPFGPEPSPPDDPDDGPGGEPLVAGGGFPVPEPSVGGWVGLDGGICDGSEVPSSVFGGATDAGGGCWSAADGDDVVRSSLVCGAAIPWNIDAVKLIELCSVSVVSTRCVTC